MMMKYKTGDIVAVQYIFQSTQKKVPTKFANSLVDTPIIGIVTHDQIYDMVFIKFTESFMNGVRSYSESQHNNQYYEEKTGMRVNISKVADGAIE